MNRKTAPTALDKIVGEELKRLNVKKESGLKDLALFEFLTKASPHYRAPTHFEALLPYFAAIEEKPMIFAFSAPPRHGKSVLTNHFVARHMIRHPGVRVAYGSYSLDLSAGFFSDEVKDILTSNGVPIDRTHNRKEEWQLENGSSFKAIAPGSGFTGRGGDLVIIDDPYKSRQTAESGAVREETWNWVKDVVITRRSPQASVIITHTRWNYEDVIGVLERDHNVPYLNFPAINDDGESLWPSEWPAERLLNEVRPIVGEYGWASLYMGSPMPRGGAVFSEAETYDVLPTKFKRVVIGIDCAYTKKTHSDYSAAVVLGVDEDGIHYVIDVVRRQCESPEFGRILQKLRTQHGNPPIYWYVGGQEKAIAEYLRNSCGVPVKDVPAREDKFVRSQAVAAAWNSKKIRIPSANKPWVQSFLSEVLSFSGLDDPHDDQVDALAAAFIPSAGKQVSRGMIKKRFF